MNSTTTLPSASGRSSSSIPIECKYRATITSTSALIINGYFDLVAVSSKMRMEFYAALSTSCDLPDTRRGQGKPDTRRGQGRVLNRPVRGAGLGRLDSKGLEPRDQENMTLQSFTLDAFRSRTSWMSSSISTNSGSPRYLSQLMSNMLATSPP